MTAPRPRALLAMSADAAQTVFDDSRLTRLAEFSDLASAVPVDIDAISDAELGDIEVLITSWGAPTLDARRLARLPKLRAVFHAAGSVREIVTDAFWDRGILITSAADANAVPVAEFTFAAIVLAGKRAFVHLRTPVEKRAQLGLLDYTNIGNVDRTIGLVGFSRIGRRVAEMLRALDVRVLVADPFAEAAAVAAAGAELVPLDDLLPQVDVLSLHAPDLPSTHHMIGAAQLAALPDGATVINTARGRILDHDALLVECRTGRLDAVLDVTDPEPLPADSELHRLPNVAITPHIAGSLGTELRRLADSALDELAAYTAGAAPQHPITAADMATSA
ncbi:hydroxyacid dehydrogenase [Microbacterium sp. H1-D42]|uniref:hydroxyacid dehydrogenase n=1 Tax=Microbacterium sp. H1-D42 TaxID=2925844 RepID=UPI001F533B67|nr:hydroxyacid dehydrogenase [Microbacterium sp. H1-D42]UNK71383.1 hydroxyacid dehydrogenase [Microbacterium sp. H1-D42]